MFLVQISDLHFIDAKMIEGIYRRDGALFAFCGSESSYMVRKEYEDIFLNHVQSLNENVTNVSKSLGVKNGKA